MPLNSGWYDSDDGELCVHAVAGDARAGRKRESESVNRHWRGAHKATT